MALFIDPLGQEVELGDLVIISDGSYASANSIHMVTRKGSTDLIQVNGRSYFRNQFLVKVNALCDSLPQPQQDRVAILRRQSVEEGWINPEPVSNKAPSPRFAIMAYVVKEYTERDRLGNPCGVPRFCSVTYRIISVSPVLRDARIKLSTVDREIRQTLTGMQYLDVNSGFITKPTQRDLDQRTGLRFYNGYSERALAARDLKSLGLENYIDQEVPREVMESIAIALPFSVRR